MVLLYCERHFMCIFNHVTLKIAVISLYLSQIHVDIKRSLPIYNEARPLTWPFEPVIGHFNKSDSSGPTWRRKFIRNAPPTQKDTPTR